MRDSGFDSLANSSVYQNIDRDLYKDDGSVALTGAAERAGNTAAGTTGDQDNIHRGVAILTMISWAATAGFGIATVVSYAIESYQDFNLWIYLHPPL